jgi:hypothetical protein
MNINYQLNANELDIKFIKSLKELFKNKEIIIHITDISDSNYLSKIPGMVESINEGIKEDLSECAKLEDIGWK